ncbi:MAG: ABC transporter ATP-binding protein [Acidobacteria bacterium]|nr:ABC transporter ATP-binding protein [Acidobacteriota bacterium]
MTDQVIEARELRKSFKGQPALAGLNLEVPAGSIFGFLGRNGAGKTTTIRTLMGLLKPDGGDACVFGLPAGDLTAGIEIRRRTGFVMEDKELYPYMTVEQILRFTRSFFPAWRTDLEKKYLKLFDLSSSRKIPDLSKGMRSKLMLLLAISHGAELLILDEPTEGLDPVGVEDLLRELVSISAAEGSTIFFSSHQLEEVEQIADRICIIDHGAAVVTGSLDDLKTRYRRLRIVLREEIPSPIQWGMGVERLRQHGRMVEVLVSDNFDTILKQAQSLPGSSVECFPVNLKEIFLEYVRSN